MAGATPRGTALGRWLNSRPVNTKVLAGIGVMAAVALTVGVLSISRMGTMNTATENLYSRGMVPLQLAQTVQGDMALVRQHGLDHGLSPDAATKAKYEKVIEDDDGKLSLDLDRYLKESAVPDLAAKLPQEWATYLKGREIFLAASRANDTAEMVRIRDAVTGPQVAKINKLVQEIVSAEDATAKHRVDVAKNTYQSARTLTIVVLGVGVLLALALGLVVARMLVGSVRQVSYVVAGLAVGDLNRRSDLTSQDEIGKMARGLDHAIGSLKGLIADFNQLAAEHGRGDIDARVDTSKHQGDFHAIASGVNQTLDAVVDPMTQVTEVLTGMADGDLTQSITTSYAGRLEKLRFAVNNMIGKLAEMVGSVIESADQINTASGQISGASQAMSQAASEQAASVEQTTASIEQMSAGITQNSDNARVTEGIASKAATDAAEGGAAVERTVEAMKQIANKISIIDDIAFQTNMLALNATIEAARAGEHGKGFAVVATEVGKLAERSQVAAQEISELASGSVQTAEHAGTLLREIVPSITKTSELVQEIAAASGEQSTGARQIDTAMSQISKITQQNASSSEELAATSEEMAAQTTQLQQLMGFFTLSGDRRSFISRPAARAAVTSATSGGLGVGRRRAEPRNLDVDDSKFGPFAQVDLAGRSSL